MKQENNLQIPVIETLRGVAASSVCLFHFVCTTTGLFSNKTLLDFFHYGRQGVEMFFIISGIVIPLSMIQGNYRYRSIFKFMARRLVRIEAPYLASVIIGVLYLTLRNYIPGSAPVDMTPSTKEVFLHVGYLIPFFEGTHWINPPYWTLAVEFQYYFFLAIAFPLVLQPDILLRIVFYLLIIVPSFFVASTAFFPHWGTFFLLGIAYIIYKKQIITGTEYLVLTVISAAIVFYFQGITELIVAGVTLSMVHFFPAFNPSIGKFFGKISYSLYLLHSIIGAAFVNFMSHRVTGSFQKVLIVMGGFAISVLSAWVMYKLIERPAQNLARKIKY